MKDLLNIGVVENVIGDTSIFWFYRRAGQVWIKIHTERCHKNARVFVLKRIVKNANLVPLGRAE